MTDNLTPAKKLVQQTIGGNDNTWGVGLNNTLGLIDTAFGGTITKTITDNTILSNTESQNTGYHFNGTLSGPKTITFPTFFGIVVLLNGTTQTLTCGLATGTTVSVPASKNTVAWSDGSNFIALATPV